MGLSVTLKLKCRLPSRFRLSATRAFPTALSELRQQCGHQQLPKKMRPSSSSLLIALPLLTLYLFNIPVIAFESLVQAQGEVRKDFPEKPLPFASPDWNFYHRTIQLQRHITNISRNCSNAEIISKIAVPSDNLSTGSAPSKDRHIDPDLSDSDTPLVLSSAANGLLYLIVRSLQSTDRTSSVRKFAKNLLRRSRHAQRTRVMFVFGEEGRDLITSEIALRVLRDVCGVRATEKPLSTATSLLNEKLKDGVELVLVPILNPDGRTMSEMGRRCDRANANDVDIDRNWPLFWEESGSLDTPSKSSGKTGRKRGEVLPNAVSRRRTSRAEHMSYLSQSRGPHPFSEAETRSLKTIAEKMRPASYISVRTGAKALTIPWDCKPALLRDEPRMRLQHVIESLSESHCARCEIGNLWNVKGRVKCGTSTDYMFGTLRIPFVHTWHVYDAPAPRGDCFRRHNPVSKDAYDAVTENWADAVFKFSNAVLDWVTLENTEGVLIAEKNASLSAIKARIKRTEASANDVPGPEREKYYGSGSEGARKSNEIHRDTTHRTGQNVEEGKTRLFKRIRNQFDKTLGSASLKNAKLGEHFVLTKRPIDIQDSNGSVLLTGWFGVSTAFCLMGAGFYVAKRYIFRRHLRRKRFFGRLGEKHA